MSTQITTEKVLYAELLLCVIYCFVYIDEKKNINK